MRQPWIDVITNSYGFSTGVRDRIYDGGNAEVSRDASERGQTIFFSAGNGNPEAAAEFINFFVSNELAPRRRLRPAGGERHVHRLFPKEPDAGGKQGLQWPCTCRGRGIALCHTGGTAYASPDRCRTDLKKIDQQQFMDQQLDAVTAQRIGLVTHVAEAASGGVPGKVAELSDELRAVDADRAAAFPDVEGHTVHDDEVNFLALADEHTGGRAVLTLGGGYEFDATVRVWALLYLITRDRPLPERLPEAWVAEWSRRLGEPLTPTLHDKPPAFVIPDEATIAQQNRDTATRMMNMAARCWY